MSGHFKTWLLWLEQISPMQKIITNYSGDDRVAMAEALAMASPLGPSGFVCVDECKCGERQSAMWSALLYAEISAKLRPTHDPDGVMKRLRMAIETDFVRPTRLDFPVELLGRLDVSVGSKTADVIEARRKFPKTYETILALTSGAK